MKYITQLLLHDNLSVKQLSDLTAVTLNYNVYIFGGYYKGTTKPTDQAYYMNSNFAFEALSLD